MKKGSIKILGVMDNGTGKHQSNTVYSSKGIDPALTTIEGGGTQQIKVLRQVKLLGNTSPNEKRQWGGVYHRKGYIPVETANQWKEPVKVIRQWKRKK